MEGDNSTYISNTSLGSETDSIIYIKNFFQHIDNEHGSQLKFLLKNWTSGYQRLAKATSNNRFPLKCRSNDLIPIDIRNLYN